jgi:hypothetical protein
MVKYSREEKEKRHEGWKGSRKSLCTHTKVTERNLQTFTKWIKKRTKQLEFIGNPEGN